MTYTDKTQIDSYLGTTLPASLTTQLNLWITAVTEWINNYVGFSFENNTASDKYFDGSGTRELFVDLYHTLVSVATLDTDGDVDTTLTIADDLVQYPLNRTAKDRIYLRSGASISKFPSYRDAVKINAKWGWAATPPEEIKLCATRLMAHLLSRRITGSEADVNSESLGDYSISYKDISEAADLLGVTNILDQYRNLDL